MNIEAHPNFHAVQFSYEIIQAIESCLTGTGKEKARNVRTSLEVVKLMTTFSLDMSQLVDKLVEGEGESW